METRGKNRAGKSPIRDPSRRVSGDGRGDNRGWQFTPKHWKKWLAERNDGPQSHLTEGIEEFRQLLNK